MKKRKLFCERSTFCYRISLLKEYIIRDIRDFFSAEKIAQNKSQYELPYIVKGHRSLILRELKDVDIKLQQNKAINLKIAGNKIDHIIINPGETFSFWKTVENPLKRYGYLEGLTISSGNIGKNIGGGLCQLANLIHWLVLNSPLEVKEIHHHTDAIFPDSNRRVPFGTGTSIFYKNVDYRFKNTSDQTVQLLIWQNNGELLGELRSEKPFQYKYRIIEENHYFSKKEDEYYRNSMVYRLIMNKDKEIIKKELLLKNHSKVLYDYSLIPPDEIKTEDTNSEVTNSNVY